MLQFFMLRKNGINYFDLSNKDIVVCNKWHYDACLKKITASTIPTKNHNILWDKDDTKGPDNPNNSEDFLLDWWMTLGNYEDYCNGANGKTKIKYCSELLEKNPACRVIKFRSRYDFLNKICSWEIKYKVASNFLDNTGQGILERDEDEATVKELTIGKFKHYYTLEPIICDRSSFKLAACLDDMFSEDYNDDSTGSDKDDKSSDDNIEVTDEYLPAQSTTNAQEVQ